MRRRQSVTSIGYKNEAIYPFTAPLYKWLPSFPYDRFHCRWSGTRDMILPRGFEAGPVTVGLPAAILIESLLYGVQLVLFCICAYILMQRRSSIQLVLLLVVTIMFLIATADLAISFRMIVDDLQTVADTSSNVALTHLYPKNPLYITNNFLADALLLYRCYLIWKGQRYIIIASSIFLVADTVWGYSSIGTAIFSLKSTFTSLFLWSVFAYNLIMTIVTAGRIWWIARAGRRLLGKRALKQYHTAIAILIESGAIYCISLLIMLLMPETSYKLIVQVVVIRLVAIMPILMIVQAELGKNTREIETSPQPLDHLRDSRTCTIFKGSLSVSGIPLDIEEQENVGYASQQPGVIPAGPNTLDR
ncbi:hypothetical protein BDZ94DRAFT_1252548 [Collybia nuda]|uniref:Uncharacterized protein n=1 Tax=Collybia nuda TaxID=64659 RepID=A0A9P6CMP0_9AGAR|nr:hypothetical protein BDZ94DRAFT_1252548 [Collybia nuda]